uniref:Uncharacterized protein n=1 Tax=Anguilla anguilla TaxID=7936 RepID=A0A0E9RR66_ANGAN
MFARSVGYLYCSTIQAANRSGPVLTTTTYPKHSCSRGTCHTVANSRN